MNDSINVDRGGVSITVFFSCLGVLTTFLLALMTYAWQATNELQVKREELANKELELFKQEFVFKKDTEAYKIKLTQLEESTKVANQFHEHYQFLLEKCEPGSYKITN